MIDPKYGISEAGYDKFVCVTTLAGSSINLIHVQMGRNSFSWQAIG